MTVDPASAPHPDLAKVLISPARIRQRVRALGRELRALYGADEITVIAIFNGAIMFTADLLRELENPVRLDCIRISSYHDRTRSEGMPRVISSLTLNLQGCRVLLIDDILDTGKTLSLVAAMIRQLQPASLHTCVLLDKPARREASFNADFVGFTIPDQFVVGYGLDYAERYRNLPCIGVLKPSLYAASPSPARGPTD